MLNRFVSNCQVQLDLFSIKVFNQALDRGEAACAKVAYRKTNIWVGVNYKYCQINEIGNRNFQYRKIPKLLFTRSIKCPLIALGFKNNLDHTLLDFIISILRGYFWFFLILMTWCGLLKIGFYSFTCRGDILLNIVQDGSKLTIESIHGLPNLY